jgi:hypothetical protein
MGHTINDDEIHEVRITLANVLYPQLVGCEEIGPSRR